MEEAKTLRHRIPLRDGEWDSIPRAARVALPSLSTQASVDVPRSIPVVQAATDAREAAIRGLTPLAREIVPLHEQAVAMYAWFDTLYELETKHHLQQAALLEEVIKTLRAVPWAHGKVQEEVKAHADAYLKARRDPGGWTQLGIIIDWTFFLHHWQMLHEQRADEREVVRAVQAFAPGRPVLTLSQILNIGRRP
jgi:hypothetical protein